MGNWAWGHEPREHYRLEAVRIDTERLEWPPNGPTRMTWTFETDAAGLIWVAPDENYPGFSVALADSLGSLSPAGEPPRLSTYWVDRTLTWLDAADGGGPSVEVASGNMSALQRDGQTVRAISLYETFAEEELPLIEVVLGLLRWRRIILDRISTDGDHVPTNEDGAVVGMRRLAFE